LREVEREGEDRSTMADVQAERIAELIEPLYPTVSDEARRELLVARNELVAEAPDAAKAEA
jgi:hypothetical protein